jgi:hypothetical protein
MEGDKIVKSFKVPTKQVKNMDDLVRWEKSQAYQVHLSSLSTLCNVTKLLI